MTPAEIAEVWAIYDEIRIFDPDISSDEAKAQAYFEFWVTTQIEQELRNDPPA